MPVDNPIIPGRFLLTIGGSGEEQEEQTESLSIFDRDFIKSFVESLGLDYEKYGQYFYSYDRTIEDILKRRGTLELGRARLAAATARRQTQDTIADLLRKTSTMAATSGFAGSGLLSERSAIALGRTKEGYYSRLQDIGYGASLAGLSTTRSIMEERASYLRRLYDIARSILQSGVETEEGFEFTPSIGSFEELYSNIMGGY